ncbi:hypothetical protein C8T65DRAFT_183039 [Cerioporus squamosus]|nr:hypothetical protein C8T65DRAFT_183039 [Cerioporus squamosus]
MVPGGRGGFARARLRSMRCASRGRWACEATVACRGRFGTPGAARPEGLGVFDQRRTGTGVAAAPRLIPPRDVSPRVRCVPRLEGREQRTRIDRPNLGRGRGRRRGRGARAAVFPTRCARSWRDWQRCRTLCCPPSPRHTTQDTGHSRHTAHGDDVGLAKGQPCLRRVEDRGLAAPTAPSLRRRRGLGTRTDRTQENADTEAKLRPTAHF